MPAVCCDVVQTLSPCVVAGFCPSGFESAGSSGIEEL